MTYQQQYDHGFRAGFAMAQKADGWTRELEDAYKSSLVNAGPYFEGFVAGVRDVQVPPRKLQKRRTT